ncbi:hypothetical protein [Streptomyces sp. UNOC14_S4]|uniref:hypothetical protein n=1 Tax=Streptomyces sp. UNOC14_S4 TaxID=2872340 RepID=UPI001E4AEFFC|nr:hypothetical protein [Streptomyces sp. UNOC14_S4]MCC3770538.1 hypothetical protein [Streptomyces sp. UNOC14_S4]
MPVARVATTEAAEAVRAFLGARGIRSTTVPVPARPRWRRVRIRRHRPGPPRWRHQVLVFADDAARARLLVNDWTLPV